MESLQLGGLGDVKLDIIKRFLIRPDRDRLETCNFGYRSTNTANYQTDNITFSGLLNDMLGVYCLVINNRGSI